MVVNYDAITEGQKGQVIDLLSKQEAIGAELANIQTERATAEIGWVAREQEYRAEQNRLTEELRKLRKATLK